MFILSTFHYRCRQKKDDKYQCCAANDLISSLKSSYYTSIIKEHSPDQRVLFRTVNKLIQKSHDTRYPPSLTNALLAD